MTYVVQLVGMVLGGFALCLTLHSGLIFVIDVRVHYLKTIGEYLVKIIPEFFVIFGFVVALFAGVTAMVFSAALAGEGNRTYIGCFTVGYMLYCVVPLWKTWFPFMFKRMFPGRRAG